MISLFKKNNAFHNPSRIILDNQIQSELDRNGFALTQFWNEEELEEARALYQRIKDQYELNYIENIHMTTWSSNSHMKNDVKEGLERINNAAAERFFHGHRTLNHVFIDKKIGVDTSFKIHQDWNIVDESKYFGINIWVPLYDVNSTTGGLWILPGSHRLQRKVRGAGYLFPDYSKFMKEIQRSAVNLEVKSGQAVIFYLNVLHGSSPNIEGSRNRTVNCFSAIPEKAPMNIYFQKDKFSPLEIHEPKDDFVYHYNNLREETIAFGPTRHPRKKLKPYRPKKVDYKELKPFVRG